MGRDVWVVGGALAVALRLSRALGTAPLRLKARGATLHAHVSSGYALYGIVLTTLLNIFIMAALVLDIALNVDTPERMVRSITNTGSLLWLLVMFLVTHGFATAASFSGHSRMTSLVHHFNHLKKATLRMHTNSEKKQKREKKRTVISILIFVIHTVMATNETLYTVVTADTQKKTVLVAYLYGAYNVSYIVGVAVGMQLFFLIYEIHGAMESLNEEFEWILCNIFETRPLNKAEEESLRRIAVLYSTVSDVVRHFNTSDGTLMLLKFGIFNIYLMRTVYNFYDSLIESVASGVSIPFKLIQQAVWCAVHITGMVLFVQPCHQTMQQVDKFRVLLSDLMYRTQPPGAPSSLCVDVLYKQLVLDTFSFSPLGVCTLTRSLFTATISALITCCVVIVQCRLGSIDKKEK